MTQSVKVGLSLTDDVQFFVCHFFARLGEKMTHEELNIIGTRKSYMIWMDTFDKKLSEHSYSQLAWLRHHPKGL